MALKITFDANDFSGEKKIRADMNIKGNIISVFIVIKDNELIAKMVKNQEEIQKFVEDNQDEIEKFIIYNITDKRMKK